MEKKERKIYGICFFLGGVFVLVFMGVLLVDLISKTIFYFMLIFFIILLLYGVVFVLISVLIISINIRLKKSFSLIIYSIGILILILSISVIIVDSFTSVNVFEILSGIGLIFLGIRLFIHKKKFKEEKKTNKIILGILLFIIGIFILISYGISIIMTIVSYNLEAVFHTIPILLLPFLIGIVLIMISKYSIKSTNTTQERKRKFILSLLMGLFILCISSLSIISMINVPYYYVFYTPFYPIFFFVIGIVLIIYSYKFQQIMGKRKLETQIKS